MWCWTTVITLQMFNVRFVSAPLQNIRFDTNRTWSNLCIALGRNRAIGLAYERCIWDSHSRQKLLYYGVHIWPREWRGRNRVFFESCSVHSCTHRRTIKLLMFHAKHLGSHTRFLCVLERWQQANKHVCLIHCQLPDSLLGRHVCLLVCSQLAYREL